MVKTGKEKVPVYDVQTGTLLSNEQDTLLRLYARANNTMEGTLLREKIIVPWIKRNKLNKDELISQILETVKRDWEIQKLKNINNPNKVVQHCDFLKSARFTFRRLPRDIIEHLMQKLKDGTDQ